MTASVVFQAPDGYDAPVIKRKERRWGSSALRSLGLAGVTALTLFSGVGAQERSQRIITPYMGAQEQAALCAAAEVSPQHAQLLDEPLHVRVRQESDISFRRERLGDVFLVDDLRQAGIVFDRASYARMFRGSQEMLVRNRELIVQGILLTPTKVVPTGHFARVPDAEQWITPVLGERSPTFRLDLESITNALISRGMYGGVVPITVSLTVEYAGRDCPSGVCVGEERFAVVVPNPICASVPKSSAAVDKREAVVISVEGGALSVSYYLDDTFGVFTPKQKDAWQLSSTVHHPYPARFLFQASSHGERASYDAGVRGLLNDSIPSSWNRHVIFVYDQADTGYYEHSDLNYGYGFFGEASLFREFSSHSRGPFILESKQFSVGAHLSLWGSAAVASGGVFYVLNPVPTRWYPQEFENTLWRYYNHEERQKTIANDPYARVLPTQFPASHGLGGYGKYSYFIHDYVNFDVMLKIMAVSSERELPSDFPVNDPFGSVLHGWGLDAWWRFSTGVHVLGPLTVGAQVSYRQHFWLVENTFLNQYPSAYISATVGMSGVIRGLNK